MNTKRTCFASVINISEIEQSEIYLTIKARLFETPRANLNGVRVTAAFLDEIVDHQDAYVCVPLYADVENLAAKNFEHLGHLYDASTGEFHSTQIGSFYKYEKETTADGFALVGYARIMKRNRAVCSSIMELFATNSLKLSFEISCGSYQKLEDNTILIDASKDNYLEGMAIVSFPACQNAVALQLVAEDATASKATEENDIEGVSEMADKNVVMTDENIVAEESVATEEVVAETSIETEENVNTEIASETIEAEEVTAADCECDKEDSEETASCGTEDEEETSSCKEKAEVEISEEKVPEENEITDEEEDEAKEENAEVQSQFAELNSKIDELANIIAELTKKIDNEKAEAKEIIAEVEAEIAEEIAPVNPVVSEIKIESKYTLLESIKSESNEYSLLEKA